MEQTTCLIGGVQPLQLPMMSNVLNTDGIGTAWGVAVSIGDPPQFFSLTPAVASNNTFVLNAKQCIGGSSNYTCTVTNHGTYVPPSGVNRTSQVQSWNGTYGWDVDSSNGFDFVFFNDDFTVGGTKIPDVPFFTYTPRSGSDVYGSGLAIGTNSSFIETALAAHTIPNKAWSLWPGLEMSDVSGLLVLGGYDEARAASKFTEFDVSKDGELELSISGIEWQSGAGATINLMPSNATQLRAWPQPYFQKVRLPYSTIKAFSDGTNGTSVDQYWSYWAEPPVGDLVITLSNGMKTRIPDEDLFTPGYSYTTEGAKNISTSPGRYGMFWYDPEYPDDVGLGIPYLSQHLLVTDFDQGKWWLADAVKSNLGSTATKLKPLCTGGPKVNGNNDDNNDHPGSKTNIGAIAGGVGGGVGALLIGAIAFCLYRRRKKSKKNKAAVPPPPPQVQEPGQQSPPPKYPQVYESEKGYNPVASPQMSHYGSSVGSPHSDAGYFQDNRVSSYPYQAYDPTQAYNPNQGYTPNQAYNTNQTAGQYELPGQNTVYAPNRYSTVSPNPIEMPGSERTNH